MSKEEKKLEEKLYLDFRWVTQVCQSMKRHVLITLPLNSCAILDKSPLHSLFPCHKMEMPSIPQGPRED